MLSGPQFGSTLPRLHIKQSPLAIAKSKIISVNRVVVHLCIPHQLDSDLYGIRITVDCVLNVPVPGRSPSLSSSYL